METGAPFKLISEVAKCDAIEVYYFTYGGIPETVRDVIAGFHVSFIAFITPNPACTSPVFK
jgi:hypothetical protein